MGLVRFHQPFTQGLQTAQRVFLDHQLVGVGAPIVAHRHRLSAPDQLCAAESKIGPAPLGHLGRATIFCAVPTLHRQHAEAVADQLAVL